MTSIFIAVVVAVATTATVFTLWIWFTHRNHRGAHATYDKAKSPTAIAHRLARSGQDTGRHHIAEPNPTPPRERSERQVA
ncbi:MAG TPA: hypothetical protein VHX38_11590 [Pseudonocardiaceae bacterium]|jgi:hypothetical protein|nr:hypothetical protein [Pseudonocardiaceae bacterium]